MLGVPESDQAMLNPPKIGGNFVRKTKVAEARAVILFFLFFRRVGREVKGGGTEKSFICAAGPSK